jgi:hypothetical protein
MQALKQQPQANQTRTIAEIVQVLSRPLPADLLATRKQGGKVLTYIPWHTVNRILDKYCPGWEGRIESVTTTQEQIFITYSITIHASDGSFTRTATGTELLACGSYGDPSSNAESQAFRRAAARFGLGLYLYIKDK